MHKEVTLAHGHHHHHHIDTSKGDARVALALAVNLALTLAQVVGGLLAGSLALIADALHNLSDAVSLGIAFLARRIARRQADSDMTFGYRRAETVAALINYTSLIIIGFYLAFEAVLRLFDPQPVIGWLVVAVAGLALAVDLVTAALTYALSKTSMNIRAAFLHNMADALGSLGVIVAGTAVILFDWHLADPVITLAIAGYILWQAFGEIGGVIRVLMLASPPELDSRQVVAAVEELPGVAGLHHVHLWMLDEHTTSFEAHVVMAQDMWHRPDALKQEIKQMLERRFAISHFTLEMEQRDCSGGREGAFSHPAG